MTVYTDPNKLQKDVNAALDKIAKYFDDSSYVKLGILGGDTNRNSIAQEKVDATNSELGFIHEFGSIKKNIPMRSWLRMPIIEKADDIMKAIAKRKTKTEEEVKNGDSPAKMYKFLGQAGEAAIQEAFDSQGFGGWEPNKTHTTPLIKTAQMRKSVTSKVEKNI